MLRFNGWIRLWIVTSVLWMAFGGLIAYDDLSRIYGSTKYDVGKEGLGHVTVVFSDAEYDSQRTVEEKWIPKIEADPSKYVGAEITEPYDSYVEKHGLRKVREMAALILLPPIFLLLLGWSIAWIRRGFAQGAHAQQGAPADGALLPK